jgi:class 3 adenylate cyclase
VNIASRIQAQAEPGGIVISEIIYQNIKNKLEVEPSMIGERKLRNVEGEVKLYQFSPQVVD